MTDTAFDTLSETLAVVLARTPAATRVLAVNEEGRAVTTAGGPPTSGVGAAVLRLWAEAARTAASRSASPLDHLVVRTTIGALAVVRCPGGLVAALAGEGVRPDRLAYELRRAVLGVSVKGPALGMRR